VAPQVAIIGSGIAGIATAIRLARKGYRVTVFEHNDYPGGKLTEVRSGGYRWDAGPSLFTMPQYVLDLFSEETNDPDTQFPYIELSTICRYFWEDGTRINAYADKEKFLEEIEASTAEPRRNVESALNRSAYLYDTLGTLFMDKSLHNVRTFLNKHAIKAYGRLSKLQFNKSMHEVNRQQFTDPKLVQLFDQIGRAHV